MLPGIRVKAGSSLPDIRHLTARQLGNFLRHSDCTGHRTYRLWIIWQCVWSLWWSQGREAWTVSADVDDWIQEIIGRFLHPNISLIKSYMLQTGKWLRSRSARGFLRTSLTANESCERPQLSFRGSCTLLFPCVLHYRHFSHPESTSIDQQVPTFQLLGVSKLLGN